MYSLSERFELVEKIASGGMANIYRAWLHGPDGFRKHLAVKVISPSLLSEPEFVEMFKKEAALAALLDHPCIVKVYEFNQVTEGFHYIAMEFIDGIDLRKLISSNTGVLSPPQVFFIGKQILRALHYAWNFLDDCGSRLELIHRDISPHNIMISRNGEVKLADFGIAKFKNAVSYTKSNMVRGKLHYLSPEQARGEELDARSDIFSLGLVLWEMLTGQKRYIKKGQDVYGEIISGYYVPPSKLRSDLDSSIDALLYCFLAPDPANRFSSAAEAVTEIEKIINSDETAFLGNICSSICDRFATVGEEPVLPVREFFTASTDLSILDEDIHMQQTLVHPIEPTALVPKDAISQVSEETGTITVPGIKKQEPSVQEKKFSWKKFGLFGLLIIISITLVAGGIFLFKLKDKNRKKSAKDSASSIEHTLDSKPDKKIQLENPPEMKEVKLIYIKPVQETEKNIKKPSGNPEVTKNQNVVMPSIIKKKSAKPAVHKSKILIIPKKSVMDKYDENGLRKIEDWE
ncbi:serine/threonine protein kinase [Myxococcota bacterium]|nr:serine/threonine protein kinase [Myxococcota bacterium]MBU1379750.1 serine/threonine protein kinase [Myxococcota bacterium]MBU1498537.1 serine/threonine protein kinase [Myxococcota bacterium]